MTPDDQARADQIRARADAATRLRAVHSSIRVRFTEPGQPDTVYCRACGTEPPCLTIQVLDRLAAETERADLAETAVERVRALHHAEPDTVAESFHDKPMFRCAHSRNEWPCRTAAALFPAEEAPKPKFLRVDNRDPACVEAWPDCYSFGYDPACCRFPKSCSAGGIDWVPAEEAPSE